MPSRHSVKHSAINSSFHYGNAGESRYSKRDLERAGADIQRLLERASMEIDQILHRIAEAKARPEFAPEHLDNAPNEIVEHMMAPVVPFQPSLSEKISLTHASRDAWVEKDTCQTCEIVSEPSEHDELEVSSVTIRKSMNAVCKEVTESLARAETGELAVRRQSTQSRRSSSSSVSFFPPDVQSIKEQIRDAIAKPEYNVENFYHETGFFQAIARNPWFENITLLVIVINAVWTAIDLDFNSAIVIGDAHPVFQVAENTFCFFFIIESSIRFGAFKNKRDCFRDFWFVFDAALAFIFMLDTWVVTLIAMFLQSFSREVFGNAPVLRLIKLVKLNRIGRLVRVLKAMPEIMFVVKGIGVATRSVFFIMTLMTIIVYVFAISFRTLASTTVLEDTLFSSVPTSMFSLFMGGIFPEYEDTVRKICDASIIMGICFAVFMFLTTVTLMNFLIGVLVEAVCSVALTEKETMQVRLVKAYVQDILTNSGVDANGDKHLNKEEFEALLLEPRNTLTMQRLGVDVVGLVEFGEVLFAGGVELSFADFVRLVLQMRGSNATTVKDIVDLRKFVYVEIENLSEHLSNLITESNGRFEKELKAANTSRLQDNRTSKRLLVG
eukprot:TRINITY_DN49472_c0_g1_i1.p1 TRINITY_DN49472_c0_g1~~TRINITY_DN49472_c0_g1_i1.p1  ORF type:complete len:610 (-),score=57.66 TRINITY_DN49472_c0_g1_i1:249-2078(-)